MRAINHALTGAVVGLTISNPIVAVGIAFVSHFALDAIPHYDDKRRFDLGTRGFTFILLLDATLCLFLVATLFAFSPDDWFMPSLCAFAATSPDLMWISRYLTARVTGKDPGVKGVIQQFHHHIQWKAWPGGLWIELAWATSTVFLVTKLI